MLAKTLCYIIMAASSSGEVPVHKHAQETACQNAEHIIEQAEKKKLDPIIMAALVVVESGWHPYAVSRAGACGLTQVLPKYSKYSCKQLKNPVTSITEGASHLSWWKKAKKSKSIRHALSCYNVGNKCLKSIQGRKYARKVLKIAKIYRNTK